MVTQQRRPAVRARARLALRLAGGGLLVATGAIHLDLYLTGYRSIPTIGWLFLLQVIAAFGLGVAVLATGTWLAAAAGAGFALATLGGYLLTLWIGLFGFKEVRTTAGIVAGVIEVAAFAALAGLAGLAAPAGLRARVPGTGVAAAAVAAVSVAALAVLGASVAVAGLPAATAAGGSLETTHIGGVTVLTNANGTHPVLVRPGYRHQVGLLRDVRRLLAAGAGSRDRRPGRHGQAGHDHPVRRVGPGHLRRASPVHLYRRHRQGPGQRQQAQPKRRAVVRGNPVRLAAENSDGAA